MNTRAGLLFLLTAFGFIFSNCSKSDPPLAPIQVSFSANELGFDAATNNLTVTIETSRPQSVPLPITINVTATGLATGADFTTDPIISSGSLSVTVPANSTSATFKVTKAEGLLLSGSEKITFNIASASDAVVGTKKSLVVSLSAIISEGSSNFVIPGKTGVSPYANDVYVDFSNNAAVTADRKSWNIAFTTDGSFKVVLNPGYQTTAVRLNKTDINAAITTADTAGIELNHDITNPATASLVDDWTGNLAKTVLGDIPANEAEAKVFVISFEGNKARDKWLKVKVSRNGTTGYKVQYANIAESTIKTITVDKDPNYNLVFLSLETGKVVAAEPRAKNWDIQWGYSTYNSGLGSPYWFQDFILLNYIGGAEAAEIVTTTDKWEADYTAFTKAGVAALTFLKTRDAIGSKWRTTTGSGIKKDRFYVVKDPSGNYYKLRFKKMGVGDTGERGKPEIDFTLLK
ncbi:MAG TPA: HmuY family protein [Niabella sp.]|nr:HmuY family protein [Niabella sp.]